MQQKKSCIALACLISALDLQVMSHVPDNTHWLLLQQLKRFGLDLTQNKEDVIECCESLRDTYIEEGYIII